MESRSLLNLLKLVLDNIDQLELGLCHLIENLRIHSFITTAEYFILDDYLFANRSIQNGYIDKYWWPKGEKEPRIRCLNLHIKILEKNQS